MLRGKGFLILCGVVVIVTPAVAQVGPGSTAPDNVWQAGT